MSETALKLLVTTLVLLWLIVTFYSSTAALVKDLCSQVRQLSYVARCAVFTGLLLATLIGGAKGILPQHVIISLIEKVATFFSGTTAESALDIEWDYLVNPESLPELTSNQCVSGLALVSVSTNPAPAYWAIGDLPTNMVAHVNPAWLRYGIAEDGYWINSTDENNVKEWSYCIGGQEVESLFISSAGTISISVPAGASASHTMPDESGLSILAPLWGPVGVVPALGSCVWSAATTNGGLLVCWNNVLIGRSTNNIASFQAELHWNGDVEFRYALPDNFITSDHVIGVQHAGGGESVTLGGGNSALSVKAFSLFFRGFTPFPYGEWDLDQDGIPANEEVYLYGTSPTHFDSDFDGISDSNEVANARNPLNPDENNNGIVDGLELNFYGQYDPDDIDPRDGLSYGYKIANGLDPARDCSIDSDGDGFPDWQEELAGTDPACGQSNPEEYQGESLLTDITITLGYSLPAPVMLTIGPRKIMMRDAGSWVLTLQQGVAHDISLSATQPCSLKLGAELSSNRALLLDTSGVFTVSHPADGTSAPSVLSTTASADAVYISGRKQCGIFARPQVKIKPPLVCFHASHPKTVEAVVTPELEGVYQWIWLNNGAVSAPAARVTNISWAGGGTAAGLVSSFHPTGAAWATFGSDTIYRCIHADDPESEDDDIEEHGGLWCSVHQQEYWRCAIDYPGQPECDHGSTTTQYPENAGRPLAVNNDDDDGDGVLDLYDTDGVIGDNDFIKIYPFSPYTGGCCPCPSHNPSASTTATRIFCSPRLTTWSDAAKTTQCTSAGRGKAVYVEGIGTSTYVGGDKIIWSWSEDGETYARTNIYTIFSLRLCGDFDFNSTINNADYLKMGDLGSLGWTVPVSSNQFRKLQLRSDVRIPGHRILSLVGDAQIRIWTTSFPSANDIPLLVTGQTVTNGIDCIDFGVYPSRMLFCEILSAGTATLSYSYVGTGEAEGYECGSTLTLTCADILSVDVIGAPNDGLVVLNGDDVTFEANVVPAGFALSTNQPIWSYRRLNSNNSWSTWTSFGSSAVGLSYTHTTEISGIFQVKASYDFGFNTTLERLYERKTDELYGLGKTGDPNAFGVTDTQIQITIRNTAKSFLGSTAYPFDGTVAAQHGFPEYPNQTFKCNIFVAHRAVQAGAAVPAINGIPATYPPLANEWAGTEDTNPYVLGFQTEIEGWTLFQHPVYPQPGFVVAHPSAVGSGHVGIVDYDGCGIGAGFSGTVNKKYTPFLDGTSGFRKHEL